MMNQTIENTTDVRKKAIIQGIVLGVISFILSIISLYITVSATSLFTSSAAAGFVNYVVFLIVAVFFVISLRKAAGGYWDFSTALKNIFIMMAITAVIGTLGVSVWNMVNPTLQQEAIDNTINMTIETMEATGANDENIDNTIEMLEQQRNALAEMSIGQILKGLAVSILMYFVLSLIFAAIFKRERPIFQSPAPSDDAHPWQNEKS
ncbi:MAG: DUF4199 domain-containing protein [Sphingobacterium hotanense]